MNSVGARDLYNKKISLARRIIERVFGMLKKRFLILDHSCEQSVATKSAQTWACLIIHNMILRERIGYEDPEEYYNDQDQQQQHEEADEAEEQDITQRERMAYERGVARRDAMVLELS